MIADIAPSAPPVPRPELTLPDAAAQAVRERYAQADTILEYGSGGSTVLAAEMPGKTIFSVESDPVWIERMRSYLAQAKPPSDVRFHHANIGPTGKWGRPVDEQGWRNYHKYPLSIWDQGDFIQPDVVLIDGRCRVGCFLATMLRAQREIVVLFDDYADRQQYKRVEKWSKPVAMHGRMAEFSIFPRAFPVENMTEILTLFTRTF